MVRRPHALRPIQSVVVAAVVVVVAELFGEVKPATMDVNTLLPGAKELCSSPRANITCLLESNNGSGTCEVYSLLKDNTFKIWKDCAESYIASKHLSKTFDEKQNVTIIDILNCKENVLLLRTVFKKKQKWLQIELPTGEHNIKLYIPGQLNQTIDIMKPTSDASCTFQLYGIFFRNLHLFQFIILTTDENSQRIPTVDVKISSTNMTNFTLTDCEGPELPNIYAETHGNVKEALTAKGIYNLSHCIFITVNYSHTVQRRFKCLHIEDMTDLPDKPPRASLDLPMWWAVGLAWLIICLILASVAPLAHRKGLLRVFLKAFDHNVQNRSNGAQYSRKRGPKQFPESRPFFEDSSTSSAAQLSRSDGETPARILNTRLMAAGEKKDNDDIERLLQATQHIIRDHSRMIPKKPECFRNASG